MNINKNSSVEEYVSNNSLFDFIYYSGPLDENMAKNIFI